MEQTWKESLLDLVLVRRVDPMREVEIANP